MKAALYCRVSTDMQAEGYSIDAQKELLASYCRIKGIGEYVYYVDAGYSGSNMQRPALTEMAEDCRRRKLGVVIVYKLDRLSRSQKDTLYLIEEVFMPNGVDFISVSENFDTASPFGRAMIGILSVFAQLERETIRERTRMGMQERVKAGYFPGGGKLPYGYDYDKKSGILVKNERSDDVRLMYEMYIGGMSAGRIARFFGIKYDSLVTNILKSKINCGIIEYNGAEYPALHEKIVDRATYDKAMDIMKRKSSNNVREGKNLLTGIVYCGVCGAKMRYQKWGNAGHKICCYSQQSDKSYMIKDKNCDNTKHFAADIEGAIRGELFKMSLDPELFSEERQNGRADSIKHIEKKIGEINRKIANLIDYIASGVVVEEISEKIDELKNEKLRLENDKRINEEYGKRRVMFMEKISGLSDVWAELDADKRRGIVLSLVDKVVITYDRIDIYYTFE